MTFGACYTALAGESSPRNRLGIGGSAGFGQAPALNFAA